MATYRVLGMIPTRAVLPGDTEPSVAPDADILRAYRALRRFPADIAYFSGGMCRIDLSVRIMADVIPAAAYFTLNSQHIMFPRYTAEHLGDFGEYDGVLILNPAALTTATTFRGLGGTSGFTPYVWCKVGSDERPILVHEWGHAMTAYMAVTTGDYTNFPVCGSEPAMHCAPQYGYVNDLHPTWLSAFLQGTIRLDGTGINATGWAVQTPTERGDKTLPTYREHPTPWGLLPPLRLGIAGVPPGGF